jgi:hypothetical protein
MCSFLRLCDDAVRHNVTPVSLRADVRSGLKGRGRDGDVAAVGWNGLLDGRDDVRLQEVFFADAPQKVSAMVDLDRDADDIY